MRCATALSLCVLAACGTAAEEPGTPVVSWYAAPDLVDAGSLADTCTSEADGAYRIEVRSLPEDVSDRHAQLVRRLLAKDDGIDLLSLDSAFTSEVAAAGFLAPVPSAVASAVSQDVAPAALEAATYDDELVVAPWWMDPQVLWYRGNTAERAGLDTTEPISWDDLIAGAKRLGVTVQVEDRDGSGLSEWVSVLVAGGGDTLVDGPGRAAAIGLNGDAGRAAASVVELYDEENVGPGPSTEARQRFAAADGGFLVASASAIADPALASVAGDVKAAPYPVIGNDSIAPLAGVGLAVPAAASDPDRSWDAVSCLTSPAVLRTLMTTGRHSASRLTTYDDEAVEAAYPDAKVVRQAVTTGRTVPRTPYWSLVLAAIDETWLPVADVTQDRTPEESQDAVRAAVRGELG
jgi:multiple sugar transport system substrate-binding protein